MFLSVLEISDTHPTGLPLYILFLYKFMIDYILIHLIFGHFLFLFYQYWICVCHHQILIKKHNFADLICLSLFIVGKHRVKNHFIFSYSIMICLLSDIINNLSSVLSGFATQFHLSTCRLAS